MRKVYILFLGLLALGSWGCDDFLEENSQDLVIPKTVENYKEFLYGEGLNNRLVINDYLDVMTDDAVEEINTRTSRRDDKRQVMWSYFTWQQYPETQIDNTLKEDLAWGEYYHRILIANIILDGVNNAAGSEAEKADLAGEAYFLRAWSYFMLVNLYGKPYIDGEQAKKDFGVPINEAVSIEEKPLSRARLQEVYDLMEKDIKASIDNFKRAGVAKNIFRPNLATSYLLASRIALFQKKYEATVAYADSVFMNTNATLYDLNGTFQSDENFLMEKNTEILFSYGWSNMNDFFNYSTSYRAYYVPSPELLALFGPEDKRGAFLCFDKNSNMKKPRKWYYLKNSVFAHAFRLSEAYLNRAEANACIGNWQAAANDVNEIRRYRIPGDYEIVATAETILQQVKDERRVEFCFEGFRWFDLRRWDRPEIRHRYSSEENPSDFIEYVLKKDDPAYTLPLPKKERDMNVGIENIDRPRRN